MKKTGEHSRPATTPTGRRRRHLIARLGVAAASAVLSLLAAEMACRILIAPDALLFDAEEEMVWRENADTNRRVLVVDPDLGFRPVLGQGQYSEVGAHVNSYSLDDRRGRTRLLFVGDSVTARNRIVRALRMRYGDDDYEYWNAGVNGFNTAQEVEFYFRWNRPIRPDHVVLTFHNNDFQFTPVVFVDEQDRIRVFAPTSRKVGVGKWFYDHSWFYRFCRMMTGSEEPFDRADAEASVREELTRLRDALASDGIGFTVVLFPILAPRRQWSDTQRWSRDASLRIFRDLGLRHLDLFDPVQMAIAAGIDVRERSQDRWHPNDVGADRIADHLVDHGLFPPPRRGFLHGLSADRYAVSERDPVAQVLHCDAGENLAGANYLLLGSASGTLDGPHIGELVVPLHRDGYFEELASRPNELIPGSGGTLDARGCATVEVPISAEIASRFAGAELHHAVIVYRGSVEDLRFVTNAVPLVITR